MSSTENKNEEVNDIQSIKNISNMELENLLLNLKIIANVKEFDKISTAYDTITIDRNDILQGTRRKMYSGDSREKTIKTIELLITRLFEITDELLEKEQTIQLKKDDVRIQITQSGYTTKCNGKESPFMDEPIATFLNITNQLSSSITGLQNLKITYLNDVTTTAKLDLVIGKIQNRINKINKLMSIKKQK
jgi:hypothetical protein